MSAGLEGIVQLAIPATDIERAKRFYRDCLGLPLLFEAPNMAFFECGGVRLYVDANAGAMKPGAYTGIYFRTRDIEGTHEALKSAGATIHEAPRLIARLPDRDVWLMWVKDSETNLLGVMEERSRAP